MARTTRPHGRDEVILAIHAAAIDLLAERGPSVVTVRQIAERAGVNHALVHRHFGTKDELIRAVLSAESQAIAESAMTRGRSVEAMFDLLEDHRAYFLALARAVLDAPTLLAGADLPAGEAFLHLVGRADDSTRDAAAAAGALALGWLVFGEHLSAVLGAANAQAVRAPVVAAIEGLTARRSTSRSG